MTELENVPQLKECQLLKDTIQKFVKNCSLFCNIQFMQQIDTCISRVVKGFGHVYDIPGYWLTDS